VLKQDSWRSLLRRAYRRVSTTAASARPAGPLVSESDVRAAYRLLLGREPDADGWHNFGAMVGKAPVSELVAAFLSSEEFRGTTMHDAVQRREREDLRIVAIDDGLRLLVSPHDLLNEGLLRSGSYETHLVAALERTISPGQTICAIGANIGHHVVRMARRTGDRGRVIAFEAHPGNAQLLARNVALNALRNVTILPVAVSDERALHRYVAAQGTNGYVEPASAEAAVAGDAALLQAVRLDDVRSVLGKVDVLQIDVEGCEGRVLRGAREVVAACRPTIFSELCLGQLRRTSAMSGEEYLGDLQRLGYHFNALAFDGRVVSFGDDAADLCAYARSQPTAHIDIRCDPLQRS